MEGYDVIGYLYAKVDAYMVACDGRRTVDGYIESKTFKLAFDKNELKFFIANMNNYKEFIKMNVKYIEWEKKIKKKYDYVKFEWEYTYANVSEVV